MSILMHVANCIRRTITPMVSTGISPGLSVLRDITARSFATELKECCGNLECIKQVRCKSPRLARDPCAPSVKKKDFKRKPDPFVSMWEFPPECCDNPCPEMLPRFDKLYWRPSDKAKRVYQQTWNECPPIMSKPRYVCDLNRICPPPFEKRPKGNRPKTACLHESSCMSRLERFCPRVKMPGCKASRVPPTCRIYPRSPSNCQKPLCPYPSYSECKKPDPKPRKPSECACANFVSLCEAFAELRRKKLYNLRF